MPIRGIGRRPAKDNGTGCRKWLLRCQVRVKPEHVRCAQLSHLPTGRYFSPALPSDCFAIDFSGRVSSPGEGRPILHTSLKGSGRGCPLLRASSDALQYCSFQARSLSLQGWGLIDLPLRAPNEGSPRPRVARAQEINRLHPLRCPARGQIVRRETYL